MKSLAKLNKEQLLKILAIVTLSDGHLYKHNEIPKNIRLATSLFGEDQHNLFRFLCEKIFSQDTKTRYATKYLTGQQSIISDFNSIKHIPALYKLSPEYNTTPGGKTKEDYLNSPQPTLKFLFNESKHMKWLALRTYFDFDGSISPSIKLKLKRDKKGIKLYEYFQVQFECEIKISETNPSIVNDLVRLCDQLGIKASIRKDKRNWSNISGICISEIASVKKFLENEGPLTTVKISSKSNRFQGIMKKDICKVICQLISDERFVHSKSFKAKKRALAYQNKFNNFLVSRLKI